MKNMIVHFKEDSFEKTACGLNPLSNCSSDVFSVNCGNCTKTERYAKACEALVNKVAEMVITTKDNTITMEISPVVCTYSGYPLSRGTNGHVSDFRVSPKPFDFTHTSSDNFKGEYEANLKKMKRTFEDKAKEVLFIVFVLSVLWNWYIYS